MTRALVNAKVFDGATWHEGAGVAFGDGRITALLAPGERPEGARDMGGAILAPGFVDTQVNGGGGVMFNSEPTVSGLAAIAAAHRRFGTTSLLPTLITDTLPVMRHAAAAMAEAIAGGAPGVRGIHFEGPCLSPERPGVHRQDLFQPLNDDILAIYTGQGLGRVLVTLAPERVGGARIGRLAAAGVRVSAGHSAATWEDMGEAVAAGLSGVTHLHNAMSPMTGRAPGLVGAALAQDGVWTGIILDGWHLHDAVALASIRAKAPGRMMLVTDAMGTVGAADKSFLLYGERIEARDGRCARADGTLAGSDLDMATAVRNCCALGIDLGEALRMASLNPASFLGLDDRIGRIAPGYEADLVALDPTTLTTIRTWIGGEPA